MPFVVTTDTSVGVEGLVLDGLNLTQGLNGSIQLEAFTPPIPKKRPEWIEASDSDGAILSRDPLVSNGQATLKLAINAADRNAAQIIIGTIVDKLEEADRNPLGIPLIWTPSGSTPTLTFYVLTGEVTEFPIDWESGYMVYKPSITITLDCLPFGEMPSYTVSGVATAGPLVTLDITGVPGDQWAKARFIITESSSQSRRTVEWGAEYLHYNPASPWSLVLDSDSLVTTGFAGVQTTLAGAYDPGAAGNSIIAFDAVSSVQAICGTGVQPHIGTFRVKARVNTGTGGSYGMNLRLAWRAGDGAYTTNDPVTVAVAVQEYLEIDLGLITIPEALLGTQSWDGRIEAWSDLVESFYIDYLMLIPVEAGYGKASASYSYSPGVVVARDDFTGTTAAAVLNARAAPVGGTWATSGVATDFVFADTVDGLSREAIQRSTAVSEASGRFAILGSTSYTNVEVQAALRRSVTPTGEAGVIARWTDASNYLRGTLIYSAAGPGLQSVTLTLTQRVAGVDTVIATTPAPILPNAFLRLRLVAFTSGRVLLWLFDATGTTIMASLDASSTAVATGGTLATGMPGIIDYNSSATAGARVYDDVLVSTPATEPVALYSGRKLEVRSDDTIRESSAGGTWGQPASYRGSRFRVQPAGTDNRTTRVVAKASRNDLSVAEDTNLTDQIKLEATITPRCSVVPRT